jgi:hypothetical protein
MNWSLLGFIQDASRVRADMGTKAHWDKVYTAKAPEAVRGTVGRRPSCS